MFPQVSEGQVLVLARKVGRLVADQYPGVDAEDISQQALADLIDKGRNMKNPTSGYVFRALERYAKAYAAKIRYDYIVSTSQYIYTPKEVKAFFEEVFFDPVVWDVPTGKDDRLSAEIGGDTIGVSLMDLKQALENVKSEYQKTIVEKYKLGNEVHHQKVTRAIDAITRSLNRIAAKTGQVEDGLCSRDVISNEESISLLYIERYNDKYEKDALEKLQDVNRRAPSKPAGTYYNW